MNNSVKLGCNLDGADCENAIFDSAELTKACAFMTNFKSASMISAILNECDLQQVYIF